MGSLEKRYAEALLSLADNVEQADVVGSALSVLGRLYQKNSEFRNFILNPVISKHVRGETLLGVLEMLGYIKNAGGMAGDMAGEIADGGACGGEAVDLAGGRELGGETVELASGEACDDEAVDLADSGACDGEAGSAASVSSNSAAASMINAGVLLLRFLQLLLDKGRLAFLPNIAEEYNSIKAKHRMALRIVARSSEPLDPDKLFELREKYRLQYGSQAAEIDNVVVPSLYGGLSVQIGGMRVDDTLYGRLAALARAVAGGAVKQSVEAG
ncbi:MAG: F0F1 ATP synthase subunit delta [Oscillospiraceae bacterium]|nr:F0F1 ATP synthase subunit delta [Oscillospiraceae bacterium]